MDAEKRLAQALWRWYKFRDGASVFVVEQNAQLVDSYDYIVVPDFAIYSDCLSESIRMLLCHLNPGGTLLLGFENGLAYRFFCGDEKVEGRKYFSKCEIKELLDDAGIQSYKVYSVLPCLEAPQFLFSDSFKPVENLSIRLRPLYNNPDSVFKFEEEGYNDLISNGLFHSMASAFFVECNDNGVFDNALQVTLSSDRGVEYFCATIIRSDNTVTKKSLFFEGRQKLEDLKENHLALKKMGLKVVDVNIKDDEISMPFINAPLGNVYLQDLAKKDKDAFIQKMDYFRDLIYKSVQDGVCYFDLVPLNSFYVEEDFVFFDQEFALDANDYPPEMLVYRSLAIVYTRFNVLKDIIPISFFMERYGINNKWGALEKISQKFLMSLTNLDELKTFYSVHQRKDALVSYNMKRQRQDHFYDALLNNNSFDCLLDKGVCVFGSGRYADKFVSLYEDECHICKVVDNNSEKWGRDFHGVQISSPQIIENAGDDLCVVICAKDYKPIYIQLLSLKVKNIVLYEADKIYAGRQTLNIPRVKKYHIGYLSGVFDLYHIGHINMFRRAKELCDYLIVGVTSDEYVINHKKRTPFIPFEERKAVVSSCKYVDEVVGVPYEYCGIVEAFQKLNYDVQFCGSDYEHHPWWLEQQKWLREHGSDLVFFSYTEQTSSTKIKALIEKGLL